MTAVLQRRQELLFAAGVAATSLCAGLLVVRSQNAMTMSLLALLALAGVAILLNLPTETLFLGWLFLTPLFQNPADASSLGRGLTWALYIAPALLLVVLVFIRRRRVITLSPIDWLPAAFVGYVIVSIWLTSDILRSDPTGSAKAIVTIVAIGPIVYYFLTFGPGIEISSVKIVATLIAAGLVQGVFAVAEVTTGWTVWNQPGWLASEGGARATATLSNPGVLGMFLGAGIVIAVAVLTWGGPRSFRLPAWIVLAVCIPGLLLTLTRGGILATAVAVVLLLLLGRARLAGMAVLAVSAIAIVALLPTLQQTELYEARVTQAATVQTRVALRDVSLQLAGEKPVFGWGYGSFDQAKNASGFTAEGVRVASVLQTTSHDTYLTILVELGVVGLLLYAAPFVILGARGLKLRASPDRRWLLAAVLGSLVVIYLSASTLDFRFFSFAQMLPFVFLAILRRMTDRGGSTLKANSSLA